MLPTMYFLFNHSAQTDRLCIIPCRVHSSIKILIFHSWCLKISSILNRDNPSCFVSPIPILVSVSVSSVWCRLVWPWYDLPRSLWMKHPVTHDTYPFMLKYFSWKSIHVLFCPAQRHSIHKVHVCSYIWSLFIYIYIYIYIYSYICLFFVLYNTIVVVVHLYSNNLVYSFISLNIISFIFHSSMLIHILVLI